MSNISIVENYEQKEVTFTTFSDGSETCKLPELEYCSTISVVVNIKDCTRDLIRIGLVKQALDYIVSPKCKVELVLTYMPQARADRVFEGGMPLPVKLFADIINSYNFDSVFIEDPHSDVAPALLNNVCVTSQKEIVQVFSGVLKYALTKDFILCAPDLGSTKKIFDVAQNLGHDKFIQAIKVRDVTTGKIVKCDVIKDFDFTGQNVLIVDDISDGGASFKFLAQKLKALGANKVGLFVTHAIFANGLESMKDIDYIWANNIIGDYITTQDLHDFNAREHK